VVRFSDAAPYVCWMPVRARHDAGVDRVAAGVAFVPEQQYAAPEGGVSELL
jgi:hypothetical protein